MFYDPHHRVEDFIARDTRDGALALDRRVLWGSATAWVTDDVWERARHPADRVALIDATLPGFIVVRDGAYLNERDGQRVVVDPGHAALYNICRTPRTLSPWGDRRRSNAFYLQGDLVAEVLEDVDPDRSRDPFNPFPQKSVEIPAASYLAIQSLCAHLRQTPNPDPIFVDEAIVRIARDLVAGAVNTPSRPTKRIRQRTQRVRDRIPEICAYLNAHATRPHTLAAIADRFQTSPYYLCRTFGEATGLTLFRYLTQVRLRGSLEQVLDGEPLTDVALDQGFSSHSHFTASFRAEFGATPREVRIPRVAHTRGSR